MLDTTLFQKHEDSHEICASLALATHYCSQVTAEKRRVCWIIPNNPEVLEILSLHCDSNHQSEFLVRHTSNLTEVLWTVQHAAKHSFDATIIMLPHSRHAVSSRAIKHIELLMRATAMQLLVVRPVDAASLPSPIPTRLALFENNGRMSQLLFKFNGVPVHADLTTLSAGTKNTSFSLPLNQLTKTVDWLNQRVCAWLNETSQHLRSCAR